MMCYYLNFHFQGQRAKEQCGAEYIVPQVYVRKPDEDQKRPKHVVLK